MGGLVSKRAVVLAKQMPIYEKIATRMKAIIFIATPHSGSDLAGTLDRLFRISSGLKPYLEDLGRNSDTVQSINAEFPTHSLGLLLHSFYETKPLSFGGLRDVMIVPKAEAVLNYPHEQSALLYGDHRSICKYADATDHNFIAVWQALAACVKDPKDQPVQRPPSLMSQSNEELSKFLNIWEPPVEDLYRVKSNRLAGTCTWLSDSLSYQEWLQCSSSELFWLRGPPGCGKSHASGLVLEELESVRKEYCYYFFNHGDRMKSTMEDFLLSMTWQMATLYPELQRDLLKICNKDPGVARSGDYRTLLRKFWEQGILRSNVAQETYWVIDAFDECRQGQELAKFLIRVQERSSGTIRMFITARNSCSDYRIPATKVVAFEIKTEHTQADIERYLDTDSFDAPGASLSERASLKDLILEKSNGCFLWVTLVLENLRKIVGTQARLRALEDLPPGMDQLYARAVSSISEEGKEISKTILTWATLAIRPLNTTEMKYIVECLAMDEVDEIETIVSRYCNDLLYIDQNQQIRLRHATARSFLLRQNIDTNLDEDFTINREDGHKILATACLKYLNGPEMKAKPKRKMVAATQQRSIFASYACLALHEHVNRSSALDNDILEGLATFLSTNILSWIEQLAERGNLDTVLRFAQVLKIFLRRKSRTDLLLSDNCVIIDTWSVDLVKLVSKFGRQLLVHPQSILHWIPPFCPPDTAPYAQFARGTGSTLTVLGLAARSWDDCLCTIVISEPKEVASGIIRRERLHAIATSDDNFYIGTSLGRIAVFNDKTCLEETVLDHQHPVVLLECAAHKPLMASASRKLIRILNTENWDQQWEITTRQNVLAMSFVDDDQLLLVALRNNTIMSLNLIDRTTELINWIDILEEPHHSWYRGTPAERAVFNRDRGLLALAYKNRHLLVYNYDLESYELFDHKDGLAVGIEQHLCVNISAMAFSNLPDSPLLVVSFSSSELVLYDIEQGTIQARVSPVWFSHLVSSPDGRTLAAARYDGTIELYDFETLHKLYRIRSEDGAVSALNFSADSTRFIVIRAGGRNCRIWDPAALYRRDVGLDSVRSPSLGSGSQDGLLEESDDSLSLISAIACDPVGVFFLVGRQDKSVSIYDARTGISAGLLFSHVASVKGLYLAAKGQLKLLVSTDTAGFLMIHKLLSNTNENWSVENVFTHRGLITGIQQFVCSEDLTRILIVSDDQASLYSVPDGKDLAARVDCTPHGRKSYVWTQHPLDSSLLMHVVAHQVRVYSWDSLQPITITSTGEDAIQLNLEDALESEIEHVAIYSATAVFTGPNTRLAISYSPSNYRNNGRGLQGSRIVSFPASALLPSTSGPSVTPLADNQSIYDTIDMIVGMYRERMVFLHVDGWICSVKAGALRNGPGPAGGKSEGVVHHFAPPLGWLRMSGQLLIRVSRLGDVLFVVKGEVAVVKRGLDRVADVTR
ncbi:hypothetical protein Daus18300_007069 [Diaporthe australafricana]|uniref:NACHT domain-containing protein n=1 Tax=Diaporthe australafricana TaxID=127596 RepID=A0ABR3WQ98_9PEZI